MIITRYHTLERLALQLQFATPAFVHGHQCPDTSGFAREEPIPLCREGK